MKVQGYCDSCRRVRPVTVSAAGLARMMTAGVPTGTCSSCREWEDIERQARSLRLDRLNRSTWQRLTPRQKQDLVVAIRRRNDALLNDWRSHA